MREAEFKAWLFTNQIEHTKQLWELELRTKRAEAEKAEAERDLAGVILRAALDHTAAAAGRASAPTGGGVLSWGDGDGSSRWP